MARVTTNDAADGPGKPYMAAILGPEGPVLGGLSVA